MITTPLPGKKKAGPAVYTHDGGSAPCCVRDEGDPALCQAMPAPDPEHLGRCGWTILHTAAAAYPHRPTPQQRQHMEQFIRSWSHVYPCSVCAYHMRQQLKEHPPVVTSKRAVSRYVCELHNGVNEMIGKDPVDCDPDKVLAFWHPTYPDMPDEPTIEEQLMMASMENGKADAGAKKAGRFGSFAGSKPDEPAVAADETDPMAVLRKLKSCQVYCPEKKIDGEK